MSPEIAAQRLRARHGFHVPINLDNALERLQIYVERRPYSQGLSGVLAMESNGSWLMLLNSLHSLERQRFTIAHEIGHWQMHRHALNLFTHSDVIASEMDREANAFAAEFLMPMETVRAMIAAGMPYIEMAMYFGVSLQAMDIQARKVTMRN